MLDKSRLNEAIACYKKELTEGQRWEDEKYKWEAIKCFQDNWDLNAPDFAEMLKASLAKTGNLLTSSNYYPRGTIEVFAEKSPEEVKACFIALFDETQDVVERILAFKESMSKIHEKHGRKGGQHYQTENTISAYLWFRYPDKYCLYKFTEVKNTAEKLGSELQFKGGAYRNNLKNFYALCNEIKATFNQDEELRGMLESCITDEHYPDPELMTLTQDFVIYVGKIWEPGENGNGNGNGDGNGAGKGGDPSPPPNENKYSKEDFLEEVFMSEEKYDRIVSVLKKKKNIILQGAPGVGKTFAAKRLAYSVMGEKDESRIELIQFHQNYSYEDFMMGYKPEGESFELKYGVFYRFCQRAANNPEKDYFFIIDEINRGNMSKIFGELLMLIENDYRGTKTTLAYNGQSFSVPKNLHIIGMMNTADRSLAMIDYALRRRFSFFDMEPGFDSEGFSKYQTKLNDETFDALISKVKELNKDITADNSLGKGFCIGHSYFCGIEECTAELLLEIIECDIIPMLSEYWFDDSGKLLHWENALRGMFQ